MFFIESEVIDQALEEGYKMVIPEQLINFVRTELTKMDNSFRLIKFKIKVSDDSYKMTCSANRFQDKTVMAAPRSMEKWVEKGVLKQKQVDAFYKKCCEYARTMRNYKSGKNNTFSYHLQ